MLKNGRIQNFENLYFLEANLNRDTNRDIAIENCRYVLHVAFPINLKLPKHEDEMLHPAVEGILCRLKAIVPMLGINRNTNNEKTKTIVDWKPGTQEEAILETVKSMAYFQNI